MNGVERGKKGSGVDSSSQNTERESNEHSKSELWERTATSIVFIQRQTGMSKIKLRLKRGKKNEKKFIKNRHKMLII